MIQDSYIHTYINTYIQNTTKYKKSINLYIHTHVHSYLYTEICQRVTFTAKIYEYHETVEILKSMRTTIHTLEDRNDSNSDFSITSLEYESMDIHVCMYVQFGLYGQVRACTAYYHDRGQHLRRDDHRPQGKAVI